MLKKIGLITMLAALSGTASAGETCQWFLGLIPYDCKPTTSGPVAAPEFDFRSSVAGLTLVLGGLVVLRARRVRNSK